MDTRIYTEGENVSKALVNSLQNKEFVVLDEGKNAFDTFGDKLEVTVQLVENKKIKSWRMNYKSTVAWQDAFGFDSVIWVGKRGVFSVEKDLKHNVEMIIGLPLQEVPKTDLNAF